MRIKLLALLVLPALFYCCNTQSKQKKEKDFDYGRVENGTYVNSYFNFTMKLPEGWVVQTKEQMEEMIARGKDIMTGNDSNLKAAVKASEVNTANLLAAFQYERGAAVDYNPNLAIVAENIKNFPGIKSGKEYLFQTRKIMEQSQLKYDHIDNIFEKEIIGKADFYKMNADIKYMGLNLKQVYYSTIVDGFSLIVIISYANDEQKQMLQNSIRTMEFK